MHARNFIARVVPHRLLPVALGCLCLSAQVCAQGAWITDTQALTADAASTPIALQFRREVALPEKPRAVRIRISADQRFVLFVNGQRVGAGPARGHLKQWRYETFDIAPMLATGTNVIAARVWNDAKSAPLAQMTSGHTAFWLQAESSDFSRLIDTGAAWQVRVDPSRTVEPGMPQLSRALGSTFYAAGPPETFQASLQADDWAERATRSQGWRAAVLANDGRDLPWTLIPDPLPQMRFERVSSGRVVRAQGVSASDFPGKGITVPAHTDAAIVIDAGRVLSAYPALLLSGGAGARVDVTYVEALYEPRHKTRRYLSIEAGPFWRSRDRGERIGAWADRYIQARWSRAALATILVAHLEIR